MICDKTGKILHQQEFLNITRLETDLSISTLSNSKAVAKQTILAIWAGLSI